jgi:hypothetical protein
MRSLLLRSPLSKRLPRKLLLKSLLLRSPLSKRLPRKLLLKSLLLRSPLSKRLPRRNRRVGHRVSEIDPVLVEAPEKCIKPFALTVDRIVKFRSNPRRGDPSIVRIATESADRLEEVDTRPGTIRRQKRITVNGCL